MVSSTASEVSPDSPSVFRYRQSGSMIWGEYTGDTVTVGRFAGTRTADRITIGFAHALVVGGTPVLGTASSDITVDDEGRMLLVEDFMKDGIQHRSVCVEVPTSGEWTIPDAVGDDPLSLDGRSFELETSTASEVDVAGPTVFDFVERDGIVWGEYRGDTVTTGYCVGVRAGNELREYFVHELVSSGEALRGDSTTFVRAGEDGRLELVEEFVLDGVPGHSICRERL